LSKLQNVTHSKRIDIIYQQFAFCYLGWIQNKGGSSFIRHNNSEEMVKIDVLKYNNTQFI